MSIEQKVALVTGAGQGIGRGIAHALARKGCRVVVTDLSQETAEAVAGEITEAGGVAVAAAGDVADRAQVRELFSASSVFGPVEILVNNAGIFPFTTFSDIGEDEWHRVIGVNVHGVFHCTQEALVCMPDGGRIITISSIAARAGIAGLTHYCASKAAVEGFTRALAVELAGRNITVNAVAPGAIDTPGAGGGAVDEATQQLLAGVPLGRKGAPEDIAEAVCYLASPEAQYVTGQVLVVDGGWTARA